MKKITIMFNLRIKVVQTLLSFHRYIISPNFSTTASINPNLIVNYLINSLGFSKDEALITSSKVSNIKSTINPNSVIDFFRSNDFSQTQIKVLIFKSPKILNCNVDETLKPKIRVFHELGFNGSDLANILILCSDLCWRSANDHLIPTLKVLKSVFWGDNKVLISAVKKSTWLFGPSAKKELPGVISLLQSYGMSFHQIKLFAIRKTRYLLLGTKVLEPILIRVEKLGIPRGTPMFFHGVCALCSFSEKNLELRTGIFKRYGVRDDDVLTLFRKNPYAMLISDSKLRKGLDFFMREVGLKPVEIASMPVVLTFGLEKRVITRYTVWKGLKEKGLLKGTNKRLQNINVGFVTCLKVNEHRFFEKFVLPFKDRCPDLYRNYMKGARPVLKSTTSIIPNSTTNYLVNSLGFSEDEALITSSKVSNNKSTTNPNSVVDFFKRNDFSQSQIKELVFKLPKILNCNVDETLKPKIRAFQDFGFNGSDLAKILILCPALCWRSVNDHLIPTLELLKSVFCGDNEVLINAVKKSSWLFGPSTRKELPGVISLLQSYGMSIDQIKLFSLRKTRYLSLGSKALELILIRVENLGIPRGTPMFFHGLCALCSISEANLELKIRIYKSYGLNDDDVLTLARKNPYALLITDAKLRKGLNFFMREVGHKPAEIASMPYVLTFSLKKRVIPRYTVWKGLKEKGLVKGTNNKRLKSINVAFVTCLTVSGPQFFEKFVLPFKDQCPALYSDYMKEARPDLGVAKYSLFVAR